MKVASATCVFQPGIFSAFVIGCMHAKLVDCVVTQIEYLSPHIVNVHFLPSRKFNFSPGQFLSVSIPGLLKKHGAIKRCYSFALSPELSQEKGYQICVKLVKDGVGSEFLRSLAVGDRFKAYAPFGDFKLKPKPEKRNLCLISTGTGIAPFRSMLGSKQLQEAGYRNIILLHGVRHENELIFLKDFQRANVYTQVIVSQPSPQWAGKKGRVTDLLHHIARTLNLSETDFFICGNGEMVEEVSDKLVSDYRVEKSAIVRENFSAKQKKVAA